MALQIDTSAIQSAQRRLDILSNNIANVNTVGFKGSSFEDVIGTALAQSGDVKKAGVKQSFSQGNITATTNALDLAISGNGLFRMENNGSVVYTRNGQFSVDKSGNITNSTGDKLTGYGVDSKGNILQTDLIALKIDASESFDPAPTNNVSLSLNLDSRGEKPSIATFSATDPTSYNDTTTTTLYNASGGGIALQTYYVKTDTGWDMYFKGPTEASITVPASGKVSLTFDASGKLVAGTDYTVTDGKGTIPFTIDGQSISMSLQAGLYASNFSANTVSQDGVTRGTMTGYKVGSGGQIVAQFSNGEHKTLGQIVLANFKNLGALESNENNQWLATANSGTVQINTPGTDGFGVIEGYSTEDSNVDLSSEMIKLISAQRAFQSAAEVVKRQDEIMQRMVNIGQ